MSDNPWAQEQAAFNQQATGQAGAGAGTSAPPGPAQQQDPATSYGAQPVPEHVITAEARQQESFPGFGLSSQGGWPSQGQDALYSSGGLAPMSQEQSERLLEWIVLRQIEDTPPIVRKGFMIVEQHTGVRRSQLAMGIAVFFALYMIFGYFAQLLCNFVGFAIPAYASMRAIESTKKEDDTKWLTYWVVFACFSVVDFFADNILRYFPFYWLAKIIFLVYCFAPIEPNGSQHVYNKFIRPFFLRNEGTINKLAAEAGSGLKTALQKAAAASAKNE